MAEAREKFLVDISHILDEFFNESAYPTTIKEYTKEMIVYMTLDYEKTMVPPLMIELSKILNPNISKEELQTATSVGWIYQLFEAHLCLQDDYLDDGDVRYGKATWQKFRNYDKTVIVHDDSLLRTLTFFTYRKFFSHSDSIYLQISDVFFEFDNTILKSGILDNRLIIKNLRNGKIDLNALSLENYNCMATLKGTGFFFMPFFSAMILAGYKLDKNSDLYKNVRKVCDDLGLLAQVSDDYYDIFHPQTVNKAASYDIDIRKGQFTWLFLMAKKNCVNDDQLQELLENYGVDSDESVAYVKAMYENIGIHDLFKNYYEEEHKKIMKNVEIFFKDDEVIHKAMKWFVAWVKKFIAVDALEIYY